MLLSTEREPVDTEHRPRLPALVYVVAAGIFLMGTTEFMLAGLLPDVASDLGVDVTRAGMLITAFAVGMIIGPPIMALATLRLPARATLVGALLVFAAGHIVAALSDSFTVVAVNEVGRSEPSPASAEVTPDEVPGVPPGLTAVPTKNTALPASAMLTAS